MQITREPLIEPSEIRLGLYQSQWMLLPQIVRTRLADVFNLKRTGGSLVQDNRQLSDGYTDKDLEVITLERMQDFLKTDEKDFLLLLTGLRNKVLEDVTEEKNEVAAQVEATVQKRTYNTKKRLAEAKAALEAAEAQV